MRERALTFLSAGGFVCFLLLACLDSAQAMAFTCGPRTALQFDGIDDSFAIPYSPTFPTATFSASAWVRLGEQSSPAATIVGRGEDNISDNAPWSLAVRNRNFAVYLEDSGEHDAWYDSGVTIADGQWHHVAATRSPTNNALTLYVDGLAVHSFSNTLIPSSANQQKMTIGCFLGADAPPQNPQPPSSFLNGLVAEVTVWNKTLASSQVFQLFQGPPAPSASGLVGFWRFNEGTGQIGSDSSASGNNGTLGFNGGSEAADPTWVTTSACCDTRTALWFDGIDDCLAIPYSATFPTATFSATAWIRLNPQSSADAGIVSRGEDNFSDNVPWWLRVINGKLTADLEDNNENDVTYDSSVVVADGQWHHVAGSRSANGLLTLYVDGVAVKSFSNTVVPSSNNQQKMTIGCSLGAWGPAQNPQPPSSFLSGFVVDVTVWNRALASGEILQLFHGPPDPGAAGLVGFWRLDEGSGQVAHDSSPAGNNGTLGFNSGPETADPEWSAQVIGAVSLRVEPSTLSWDARPPYVEDAYDVVRGNLEALRAATGDFSAATDSCLANNQQGTALDYSASPDAGGGIWFLVRRVTHASNGTYDSCSPSQVGLRDSGIAASGEDCP